MSRGTVEVIIKGDTAMVNRAVRHGEAMLVPVEKAVKGSEHTTFVVAHSETGHHHVLESDKPFVVNKSDREFLIELFSPAKLVHKKATDRHNTLTITPGKYKVVYKNEYNPFLEVIQQVQD